jgi:hypothetical protein
VASGFITQHLRLRTRSFFAERITNRIPQFLVFYGIIQFSVIKNSFGEDRREPADGQKSFISKERSEFHLLFKAINKKVLA